MGRRASRWPGRALAPAVAIFASAGCSFDGSGLRADIDGAPPGLDAPISSGTDAASAIDGGSADAPESDAAPCEPTAGCTEGEVITDSDERCLVLCTVSPRSWTDAQLDCEASGGDLVTVRNTDENEAIASAIGNGDVWIGYYQSSDADEPDSGWAWISGGDSSIEPWEPGQPNNNTDILSEEGQDCGFLRGSPGTWFDHECVIALPYVCELR